MQQNNSSGQQKYFNHHSEYETPGLMIIYEVQEKDPLFSCKKCLYALHVIGEQANISQMKTWNYMLIQ